MTAEPRIEQAAPAARLGFFYGAVFAFVGVYMPFWPVWLESRGLGAAEIGLLLSAGLWTKLLFNPLIAALADRRGERRGLMVLLAAGGLASYLLFAVASGFWQLLAVALLAGVCFSSLNPLGEAVTLAVAYERGLDYGRIRLWGSLAFILASALGGRALGLYGADAVLWLLWACMALTVLACALLPAPSAAPVPRPGFGIGRLLRQPVFLLFLLSASLVQASHAMLYGFGTLHWQAAGIPDRVIGWLWAEGVVAEILLFAFSGAVVARLGIMPLLWLAAGAGVLRWSAMAFDPGLPLLVLLQALHALTFGATHLAAMHFIARAAPPEFAATAQSLLSAVGIGIAMGLATASSGLLYGALGGGGFLVMAGVAAVGAAAALALATRWDGGRLAV